MNDQGLHICHIGQEGADSQVAGKLPGGVAVFLDLKGKDAAAAMGEILLIQSMSGLRRQRRMMHRFHLGILRETINNFQRILHTEEERFQTLQEEECMKWRERRAGISEQDRPDPNLDAKVYETPALPSGYNTVHPVPDQQHGAGSASAPHRRNLLLFNAFILSIQWMIVQYESMIAFNRCCLSESEDCSVCASAFTPVPARAPLGRSDTSTQPPAYFATSLR